MPGRTACYYALDQLKRTFEAEAVVSAEKFTRSYNVAPKRFQPILIEEEGEDGKIHRKIVVAKWSLVPHWCEPDDTKVPHPINARSDSLSTSTMFIHVANKKRCVVLTNGYYEWHRTKKVKQPYFFKLPKGARPGGHLAHDEATDPEAHAYDVMTLAGLYDRYENEDTGEVMYSYAIVTEPASREVKEIHPRMPAVLEAEEISLWVDPKKELKEVRHCLKAKENLVFFPVSTRMNDLHYDSPDCIEKIDIETDEAKAAEVPEDHILGTWESDVHEPPAGWTLGARRVRTRSRSPSTETENAGGEEGEVKSRRGKKRKAEEDPDAAPSELPPLYSSKRVKIDE